jgi:hypothetical protein
MSMDDMQVGAGTQLPTRIKSQEIVIPENVAAEIKRLHVALVASAKAFEEARGAFGEFIRVTKKALNVPAEENWSIREDASSFVRLGEEGNRG